MESPQYMQKGSVGPHVTLVQVFSAGPWPAIQQQDKLSMIGNTAKSPPSWSKNFRHSINWKPTETGVQQRAVAQVGRMV